MYFLELKIIEIFISITKLNSSEWEDKSDDIPDVETVQAAESVAGVVLGQLDDAIAGPGGRAGQRVEGRVWNIFHFLSIQIIFRRMNSLEKLIIILILCYQSRWICPATSSSSLCPPCKDSEWVSWYSFLSLETGNSRTLAGTPLQALQPTRERYSASISATLRSSIWPVSSLRM